MPFCRARSRDYRRAQQNKGNFAFLIPEAFRAELPLSWMFVPEDEEGGV
jgi:hypothetical protein